MSKVKDFYIFLDSIAPFSSQEEWDNSGLIAGDRNREVKKIAVVLDVSDNVLSQCIENNADLIISHHPLIFKGVKNVMSESVLYKLIKSGISLISTHTCFDKAENGVNDVLCRKIGLKNIEMSADVPFIRKGSIDSVSPAEFAKKVQNALGGKVSFADGEKNITSVAVCSGSGGDFVYELVRSDIDAFLTGEASYHDMLFAKENGLTVVSAGHYETEKIAMDDLSERIKEQFPEVEIIPVDEKCDIQYI